MDFRIFESTPGISVVVLPDAPVYTHVAISHDFLKATGMCREDVVGKGHFEVFPQSPNDPHAQGALNLKASFDYIVQHRQPHDIPVQRYDVPNADGSFTEKYWKISNAPVLDGAGEVAYIIHSAQDITAQVLSEQHEKALKMMAQQHEELRFVMDFMPQLVWHTLPDGKADFFNKVYLDFSGLEMNQLTGHQWVTLLHPDDVATTATVWQEALAEGCDYEVEHRLRGKDGTYRWFLTRGRPLKNAGGQVLRWYGTTTDIQEHKLQEELLEKRVQERTADLERQRTLLDSILAHSPAGITVYRAIRNEEHAVVDFHCIVANEAAAHFSGISNEDRFCKTVLEITPSLFSSPLFKMAVVALEQGTPFRTEYHNDQLNKWLELSVVKMDDEHLINVFRDITAIKETQAEIERSAARFRGVFNATQMGMFTFTPVVDEQGEITDFRFVITNPAFAAYVGQTPEVLNGELGSTWFPGYLHNGVFEMYRQTYLTGETKRIDIHYNVDQHDIYLDLQSTRVGDEVLVTFNDYTQLKSAQLQLERYVEELKHSNANLEEFAYAASHDLKEPIRKIHFFTDLLRNSLGDRLLAEERRYFERMELAAKRMSTLIDDLLFYSFVTKGAILESSVDLNTKVRMVLEDLELEIQQKDAHITIGPLPVIKGHRRQLQQLFHNLIGNALKYSKQGVKPEIRISARMVKGSETTLPLANVEASRQYHLIEVRDNGIGFEKQDARRIFNLFTRLHGNAEYRGTGVGLSIAHKVAENHQGYIWAESEPDKGAVFNVLLPVL